MGALVLSPVPSLLATSHQYTWSLLMFLGPSAVIALWLFNEKQWDLWHTRRALGLTLLCLVPLGCLLNLLLARHFFVYPNPAAVCGLSVPGLTSAGFTGPPIPVEEFVFYASGFVVLLLVYGWCDHVFFARYQARHAAVVDQPILALALLPAAMVLALAVLGLVLRRSLVAAPGFPGYLLFLLVFPLLATLVLWRRAEKLINWQAFSFTAVSLLGISVLWEVSLAVPGGWWGYQPDQMVGLFIHPWHELPVEAVLVWVLTTYTTVVMFEAFRVRLHRKRPTPPPTPGETGETGVRP